MSKKHFADTWDKTVMKSKETTVLDQEFQGLSVVKRFWTFQTWRIVYNSSDIWKFTYELSDINQQNDYKVILDLFRLKSTTLQ